MTENVSNHNMNEIVDQAVFNSDGLIPAILQDANTASILMMAWMNKEALTLTMQTKKATFWSRSRGEIWVKGETSGNIQWVDDAYLDCDNDALLLRVNPAGPACHTGATSCFFRRLVC